MQNLEKRIEALEATTAPPNELTIIRRIVAPGHLDAEIDHIRDDHGNEWMRQHGETEAAFTDRAASETPPSAWGFRALIGTTLEHLHEDN